MKILLLSDATMSTETGGIAQTLYNVFSFVDPADILCITSKKSHQEYPPSQPFKDRYITYGFEIIHVPRNRFAKYIQPLADRFNYTVNHKLRRFKSIRKEIISFDPDVVVSCPNGSVGLFMHEKLLKGLPEKKVFPYFMDDWMSQKNNTWLDRKIHQWTKGLLQENPSWLMISRELSQIVSEKYKIIPERVLEIHNPVDLSNAPDPLPVQYKNSFTLAYAGALWNMHIDAFCVIANGIRKLRATRNIELIVYTSPDHWNSRKDLLEPLGVTYGGSIPYKNIHQKLSGADALILSSSFTKEYYTHSKGSIQTKITDYLKSKRLIISCGPPYSANHNFLKKHHCGVCIETTDEIAVAGRLDEILENIMEYQSLVTNGWKLLENEFTFSKVHTKLQNFLAVTAVPRPHLTTAVLPDEFN